MTVQKRWTMLVALAAALAVAVVPLLVTDRFLLKILTFVGINVIVVTGLALLFGYAGQVSLGHAAFVGIGAYTCANLTVKLQLPWLVAFVAAGAVAAVGGLVLAVPSLRLKGHYLAMATLGFGELMSIAFVEAQKVTGGIDGFGGIPFPTLGPIEVRTPPGLYWLVWGVAGLAMLVAANLVTKRPGRAMRAVHGSELGAQASGVDVTGIKVRVFTLSAAMAGIAGALYASFVGFVSPSAFTLQASVTYLAMAVLGGAASLAGPALSAALLTLLQYTNALLPGLPRRGDGGHPKLRPRHLRTLNHPRGAVRATGDRGPVASAKGRRGAGSMTLLSVKDVTKRFGGLTAVDSVTFDVHEGTIKALIGPNGAGKSTLFNSLTGFDRPDSGSVVVRRNRDHGVDSARVREARGCPDVPEHAAVRRPDRPRERDRRPTGPPIDRLPLRGSAVADCGGTGS